MVIRGAVAEFFSPLKRQAKLSSLFLPSVPRIMTSSPLRPATTRCPVRILSTETPGAKLTANAAESLSIIFVFSTFETTFVSISSFDSGLPSKRI